MLSFVVLRFLGGALAIPMQYHWILRVVFCLSFFADSQIHVQLVVGFLRGSEMRLRVRVLFRFSLNTHDSLLNIVC